MQRSKVGLLLAAAAAYGAYRYSRMSSEQKANLKTKGKDFLGKNMGGLKNWFNKAKATTNANGV